jgi:NAD(P)H dehydrogenase (quinone)
MRHNLDGYQRHAPLLVLARAAARDPPRLVVLSSVGSQQSGGLGTITSTHLLEEALGDLPFPTAIVRAGSFLENYTRGL